jgi:Transposase zinc-binding domain/Putative transposase
MSRPTLEVADIVRAAGNSFWEQQQSHLAWPHRKVLDAIVRCRTAALGGHRDQCVRCGHQAISFNSCRNRHCPKCQGNARAKWLAARSAELLPVPYFHVVFTLPHELSALVLQNKRLLYDLLYRTSAATMLELARDPKHLGADIGFLGVLHTWGQNLEHHPHVHYIVPAGGLALDGSRWIDSSRRSFLPKGLVRIRHFGLFANRRRSAALERCRALLGTTTCVDPHEQPSLRCPACSGIMLVVERLTRGQLYFRASSDPSEPRRCGDDSS